MSLIVDRFEGNWVVIEYNKCYFNLPKELLPKGVKEGQAINLKIEIDKAVTGERKKRINKLMNDLFE